MTLLYPTHLTYRRIDAAHDYRPSALRAANDTCARCGNALCDCPDAFWNPRQPRATVARSGEITLPTGPGGFVSLFHAAEVVDV